jgi:hypothetical protein
MISSTFYDLKQVRSELHQFIERMGYESLLSENATFPINPDLDTIENCKKKIEPFADILVLIIGGRYGYIEEKTGKSITNLEYIEARNKKIPIYVFIEQKVLTAFEIWEKSKDNDYSSVVDTIEVFNFIERIRNTDSVWTFSFNVIKDIEDTLLIQFSYLFKSSLDDRLKLRKTSTDIIFDTLSAKALLLVLEKPPLWEYLLFFQTWLDENEKLSEKYYMYTHNLKFFKSEILSIDNFSNWANLKTYEILGYIESANFLISKQVKIAWGPAGVPGDAREIIMAAKNLLKLLETTIDWCMDIRQKKVDEPLKNVLDILSKIPSQMINEMINFPSRALVKIHEAIPHIHDDKPYPLELTIVFEAMHIDEFNHALEKCTAYYTSR